MNQFAILFEEAPRQISKKLKMTLKSFQNKMEQINDDKQSKQQEKIQHAESHWQKLVKFFKQASSIVANKTEQLLHNGIKLSPNLNPGNQMDPHSQEKPTMDNKDQQPINNTQLTEGSTVIQIRQQTQRTEDLKKKLQVFLTNWITKLNAKNMEGKRFFISKLKAQKTQKPQIKLINESLEKNEFNQPELYQRNQKNPNFLENLTEDNRFKDSSITTIVGSPQQQIKSSEATIKSAILTPVKQKPPRHSAQHSTPTNKKPPLPPKLLTQQDLKELYFPEQSDKLFESYVQQERLTRIKRQVDSLKKQHMVTNINYDASDEQDPEESDFNRKFKQKTEISGHDYKFFEPRIYVFEAPERENTSSLKLRAEDEQKEWPLTDPKDKNKNQKSVFVSPILSRSPDLNKKSLKTNSYTGLTPQLSQKMTRLKEAKRKKVDLSKKLQQLNRQLEELRTADNIINRSKSPKNSLKQMIHISDDKNARIKAMSLVHRLKIQRIKRQKVVNNIFRRVDSQITNSIDQMTQMRAERSRREKQKKQLQVLQRMRDQQKKKLQEYRLQSANIHFLQAIRKYQLKKYGKYNNSPELLNRKETILKLQNFSQKRSLLQDYNRDLLLRRP